MVKVGVVVVVAEVDVLVVVDERIDTIEIIVVDIMMMQEVLLLQVAIHRLMPIHLKLPLNIFVVVLVVAITLIMLEEAILLLYTLVLTSLSSNSNNHVVISKVDMDPSLVGVVDEDIVAAVEGEEVLMQEDGVQAVLDKMIDMRRLNVGTATSRKWDFLLHQGLC